MGFPKSKSYQNLTTESGAKQRFSLLQETIVIQAVNYRYKSLILDLKGGLWLVRKSQKISTASDQRFYYGRSRVSDLNLNN